MEWNKFRNRVTRQWKNLQCKSYFRKKPIKLKCDCCKRRMPSKPFVRKPKPNLRIQAKVSGLDAHLQAGLRDGLVLGGHLHPVLQRLRHLFGLLNGISSLPVSNVKHPLKQKFRLILCFVWKKSGNSKKCTLLKRYVALLPAYCLFSLEKHGGFIWSQTPEPPSEVYYLRRVIYLGGRMSWSRASWTDLANAHRGHFEELTWAQKP